MFGNFERRYNIAKTSFLGEGQSLAMMMAMINFFDDLVPEFFHFFNWKREEGWKGGRRGRKVVGI